MSMRSLLAFVLTFLLTAGLGLAIVYATAKPPATADGPGQPRSAQPKGEVVSFPAAGVPGRSAVAPEPASQGKSCCDH